MTRIARCKKAIWHWNRMIAWVKEQDPYEVPCDAFMRKHIHQDWYAKSCSFCEVCLVDDGDEHDCSECPIRVAGFLSCMTSRSKWARVQDSSTWDEWLKYANEMLELLKKVLANEQKRAKKKD